MAVWGSLAYGLRTCTGVQEGFAVAWMDLGVVVEPKKLWASSGCSVLTH
jgi:hypothetical protein